MLEDKKIPLPVIRRLPRYYRHLGDLLDAGVNRISSRELSARMNITASQIRQDLNNFGCFGQQGYGYNVEFLYGEIKRILGLGKTHRLIVIGAGKIGEALINYAGFERRGFKFVGAFDVRRIGEEIKGISIMHVNELDSFLKENEIDVAVLSVPGEAAQDLVPVLQDNRIRGIWNFSPIDLSADIPVENVNLADSLMSLLYRLR